MAEESKERTSENVTSETTSEKTGATQQERPKLPPVDFMSLISDFATTAFAYLGGFQDPETKEVLVELEMAKRMIDTIDLLKEKTKGNLTAPEQNFLENTLYNLKMTYVRLVNNPPPNVKKPKASDSRDEKPSEEKKSES